MVLEKAKTFAGLVTFIIGALVGSIMPFFIRDKVIMLTSRVMRWFMTGKAVIRGDKRSLEHPAIYVCNHYGWLDAVILRAIIPNLYFTVKDDVFKANTTNNIVITLSSILIRGYNMIPYIRGNKDSGKQVRQTISNYLAKGRSVLIFPEGTSHERGPPSDFYSGAFELARDNGVKIVPLSLHYSPWVGVNRGGRVSFLDDVRKQTTATLTIHPAVSSEEVEKSKVECFDAITNDIIELEKAN
jgi:1-acyl-sn-glycerol-3-phosphate acyltransferase